MKTTTEVQGRNGYIYDATPVSGELFIVGKYIVKVDAGRVTDTVCRATKANVNRLSN